MKPSLCGVGPLLCQASTHSMAALSAHIGAPPGSMHVHPLFPSWITFILPSWPVFITVACSRTCTGAACLSFVMSSWSSTVACCAYASEAELTMVEVKNSKADARFIGVLSSVVPLIIQPDRGVAQGVAEGDRGVPRGMSRTPQLAPLRPKQRVYLGSGAIGADDLESKS